MLQRVAVAAIVTSERRAGTKSSTAAHTQSPTPQTAQARHFPRFINLHAQPTFSWHRRRTRLCPRLRCSSHGRGLRLAEACSRAQRRSRRYLDPIHKQIGQVWPPHASRSFHRAQTGSRAEARIGFDDLTAQVEFDRGPEKSQTCFDGDLTVI